MHTKVIFTVAKQTGISTKLSLALKRLGYKFISVQRSEHPDKSRNLIKITFTISVNKVLTSSDFNEIIKGDLGVERVDIERDEAPQTQSQQVISAFKATASQEPTQVSQEKKPKRQSVRSLMSRRGSG